MDSNSTWKQYSIANNQGFTNIENRKCVHVLEVAGRSGARFLPWGDRYIPLRPGEKDPEAFRHPSGFVLKNGAEWRNINRNYPGRADGTPAERVTFAVMELIRREGVAFSLAH